MKNSQRSLFLEQVTSVLCKMFFILFLLYSLYSLVPRLHPHTMKGTWSHFSVFVGCAESVVLQVSHQIAGLHYLWSYHSNKCYNHASQE